MRLNPILNCFTNKEEKEQAIITAPPGGKTILKQQLRIEVLQPIGEYEQEYWQIIANQSNLAEIPEAEAEVVVAEFVKGVGTTSGRKRRSYRIHLVSFIM
jgi:hypothetical protein